MTVEDLRNKLNDIPGNYEIVIELPDDAYPISDIDVEYEENIVTLYI